MDHWGDEGHFPVIFGRKRWTHAGHVKSLHQLFFHRQTVQFGNSVYEPKGHTLLSQDTDCIHNCYVETIKMMKYGIVGIFFVILKTHKNVNLNNIHDDSKA